MKGHASEWTRTEGRRVLALISGAGLLRLALAAFVTRFVLVDDAYIHLRYARNLVEEGQFVYNLGQPVFGLTSPLFGLVTAGLHFLCGSWTPTAVLCLNLVLWSAVAWWIARRVPARARGAVLALVLFWPSFVDNQLLGMETPLFVLLLCTSMGRALDGRVRSSAWIFGLALVTRPEALLSAPFLLLAAHGAHERSEWRRTLASVLHPSALVGLLLPLALWSWFASAHYGSVLPQSMLAKSGWNSEHYDGLFGLESALLAFPRLTFLPFVDALPVALRWISVASVLVAVALVGWFALRGGDRAARLWFGFYGSYMLFFLLGKGATEASWYSIPASVALLLASAPLWSQVGSRRRSTVLVPGLAVGCALLSVGVAVQRADLLERYVRGYGAAAAALNEACPTRQRVLIGEIGVYGYVSRHEIIDVGALVSPEVLPLKNAGVSFTELIRATGASHFVISERALESNVYPSVGCVWRDAGEREWFRGNCRELFRHGGKRTFVVGGVLGRVSLGFGI